MHNVVILSGVEPQAKRSRRIFPAKLTTLPFEEGGLPRPKGLAALRSGETDEVLGSWFHTFIVTEARSKMSGDLISHGKAVTASPEGKAFGGPSFASVKEMPHNARGPLAGEFQPLAACKNLDYPPGNLRFLQFAID